MPAAVRILVLDPDDRTAAECLKAFRGRGWHADRAGTFQEAEGLLAEASYDVALVELLLPDIDGTEAWSRIRAGSRDTLGIITTASASLHNSIFAAERGIVAYLQKPLRMAPLCSFIDESVQYQRGAKRDDTTRGQLVGLWQLMTSITRTPDPAQALKKALTHLRAIIKFDFAAVYLVNQDKSSWTRIVQSRPFPLQIELTDEQSEFIQGLAVEAIHSLQPKVLLQSDVSDRGVQRRQLQKLGFWELLLVPILGPGEPYGAVVVLSNLDTGRSFAPYDVHLLTIVSQGLALALDRAHIVKQLGQEPIHDEATGAYSSAYLDALIGMEAARWKRFARPFCLVLLDAADLGRRSQDRTEDSQLSVQREIAQDIHSLLRRSDVVARLPDWRVAVLLPETSQKGAERALARMTEVIEGRLAERSGIPAAPLKTQVVTPTEDSNNLGDLLGLALP
jgi:DNA-binding response OmpR family regulator/GGDEF domain-containing protein